VILASRKPINVIRNHKNEENSTKTARNYQFACPFSGCFWSATSLGRSRPAIWNFASIVGRGLI